MSTTRILRELREKAETNLAHGLGTVTVVLPRGVRIPGMPRGELLCVFTGETGREQDIRLVKAARLLKWIAKAEAELATDTATEEGRDHDYVRPE